VNDDQVLSYYCRNCGYQDNNVTDNYCALKTENTFGSQIYNYTINEFTKMDPTLPRIYNKECINPECKTNKLNDKGEKPTAEIIYMRYDDSNLLYVYICVECDATWKTDS
jgi:DNA-directed RNA polymerase subunit M/transcription elongation factor TFIIS